MRPFIFTERNGIHIIDLRKTLDRLQAAQRPCARSFSAATGSCSSARSAAPPGHRAGGAAQRLVLRDRAVARRNAHQLPDDPEADPAPEGAGARPGGERLRVLHEEGAAAARPRAPQARQVLLGREGHGRLPGAVFVVDARREIIAVREAPSLGIPVIAITDTNADPDLIDYPDPRQRRRDPLGEPDQRRPSPTPSRSRAARCRRTTAGASRSSRPPPTPPRPARRRPRAGEATAAASARQAASEARGDRAAPEGRREDGRRRGRRGRNEE
jgi:hypothetical protein